MEDAVKLMGMPGELSIDREGRWRHDGVEVSHTGIADYLSKHLRWSDAHGFYVVEVDGRAVRISVEDTAYFVVALDTECAPWQITLNDGSSAEPLVGPIEVRENGEFVCMVKHGRFPAKINRNVHQQLQPYVIAVGKSFENGSDGYAIRTASGELELICRSRSAV